MEKKNYNFIGLRKVNNLSIGYVEGWTFKPKNGDLLNTRKVTVEGEEKSVASLTLNGNYAQSVIKYHFGEELVNEVTFIEATAWGVVADRLTKFNPTAKMLLGLVGALKVVEYDKKDGSGKGKKIVMTIDNFKLVYNSNKNAGTTTNTTVDTTADNTFVGEPDVGDIPF